MVEGFEQERLEFKRGYNRLYAGGLERTWRWATPLALNKKTD